MAGSQDRIESSLQLIHRTEKLYCSSLLQVPYHLTNLKDKTWLNDNSRVKKHCGGELAQKHSLSFIQEP